MTKTSKIILVIEDEKLLLKAISKKLTLAGFEVRSFTGGESAIKFLKKCSRPPSAVWLDYHLKGMDGLAFMQVLKSDSLWKKIPVIVVSNSASPDKVSHMLTLGADRYLLKAEYRLEEIIVMIKEVIEKNL